MPDRPAANFFGCGVAAAPRSTWQLPRPTACPVILWLLRPALLLALLLIRRGLPLPLPVPGACVLLLPLLLLLLLLLYGALAPRLSASWPDSTVLLDRAAWPPGRTPARCRPARAPMFFLKVHWQRSRRCKSSRARAPAQFQATGGRPGPSATLTLPIPSNVPRA